MEFTWLTDIHLNFLKLNARKKFYTIVKNHPGKIVLISGDIAEATCLIALLKEMSLEIQKPIYFVLGNHDYYRGSILKVRSEIFDLKENEKFLNYLPFCEPVVLENSLVLVGEDGWADGRYGDYFASQVSLNDSYLISDLFQKKLISRAALLEKMQALADVDAKKLQEKIDDSVQKYQPKKVIVLTHVPPFREACLYNGEISGDDYLPYFASKAMGDVLMDLARANPAISFLVLSGHSHSQAFSKPLSNLEVRVGGAEYSAPELQIPTSSLVF